MYVNCIHHIIHHLHVSTAVADIIRVINDITSPHETLKFIIEPLTITKRISNFLHSHQISAY